jgi:hypothetical protein
VQVSVILTINNRSPEVSKQVADSFKLPGNTPDELVIVLDRPTEEAMMGSKVYAEIDCPIKYAQKWSKTQEMSKKRGKSAKKGQMLPLGPVTTPFPRI